MLRMCEERIAVNTDGESALHIACKCGHLKDVEVLLNDSECDLNIQNSYGDTPLHIAIKYTQYDTIVQLLSYKECNPNVQNKEGDTPLHVAVQVNMTAAISQLVAHQQCNINAQNKVGDTPLHIAVRNRGCYLLDYPIVQLLSSKKCDLNAQNKVGNTPLHIAVRHSNMTAISRLLAHQQCNVNVQNKEGDTPLHSAVRYNITSTFQLLSYNQVNDSSVAEDGSDSEGVEIQEVKESTAMEENDGIEECNVSVADAACCSTANTDTTKINEAKVEMDSDTPLYSAVRGNMTPISQLLFHKQCNVDVQNNEGDTPLHSAVRWHKLAALFQLLAHQKCNLYAKNMEGDTPLHIACYMKSLEIIRFLLKMKCSTTIPNKKGDTAQNIPLNEDGECLLQIACQWDDVDIIRYLIIDEKCNSNVQSTTPLHIAARYGQDDTIVQVLMLYMASDMNSQNNEGDTPLHIAVRESKTVIISRLLAYQHCNVNVQNKEGDTPLHIAVRWSNTASLFQLTAHQQCNPHVKNREGDTPLHIACHTRALNIITILLEMRCSTNIRNKKGETAQGIPLNEDGDCLLHIACQLGDVDIARYLVIDEKCNPNIQSYTTQDTPLHTAVKHEQDDAIFQLLSFKGCNLNVQNMSGDTPLHIAVRQNKTATISQLLACQQCNINIKNKRGDTPLHFAVEVQNDMTVVELLSCKECDPNVQNEKGNTPLHIACYRRSLHIIKLLLEKRCRTNIPNKKGEAAQDISLNEDGDCLLHIACEWGDVNIVRYLVTDQSCNLNIPNKRRNRPLHIACYQRLLDIIRLLLEMRCCTSIPNKNGETAQDIPLNGDGDCLLHIACWWGDVGIVRHLVTDGRRYTNLLNADLNTPLHIACYRKSIAIVRILIESRCSTNIQNKKGDIAQEIPLNEAGDCLLHIVCQWDDVNTVKYLFLDKPCNLSILNACLSTPLHIACYQNSLSIVRFLLEIRCSTDVSNKNGETAQDIPLNEHGDCLLHIACKWGDVNIVSYLVTDQRCDVNIQNTDLNTPLHFACYMKFLSIIKVLLEKRCRTNILNKNGETAQDVPLNEDGDTLLQIGCQWGDTDIVKYLITDERCNPCVQSSFSGNTPLHMAVKYGQDDSVVRLLYEHCDLNPNVQNQEGDTPLHIACYRNSFSIIRFLLEMRCSTNISNRKGEIAQNIPINGDHLVHIACEWGDVGIVRYLIIDQRCDVSIHNIYWNTPLHIACYKKSLMIVKLLLEKRCRTNIPNKKGETAQDVPLSEDGGCLLHIACQWGDVNIVRYLITDEKCNPNVQNLSKNTPLHVLVNSEHCQSDLIAELLSSKMCDPNIQNENGDTPLHIAVRVNITSVISLLLTNKQCNPNIVNNDHLTPLLIAIKHNNFSVSTSLLQHKYCNPFVCDVQGNTSLHLACISGESQPEMVKVAKQLLASVDPSCVNNAGQTPIELTTNYQLIQAISHLVKCKTKHSIQTYINIFIVGNPETGKSTLVQAICKEASILWKVVPKPVRRVKNVPLHTAGIIPTKFRSKKFGNTVLYDLAGQVEYYTSHAAVIKSTVISTPPAFIVVVNLSKSEEEVSETLRYWWSFIDNHAAQCSAPPQVILVGSHADVVKSSGKSVQEKMTQLSDLLKRLPASFQLAGQIALDCRDPASRKLRHFCSLVNQSCTALRQKADVDLRCHLLYAFLLDSFKSEVACTVSDVATSVKKANDLLPQNPDELIPFISTLSDKGLLLLVKGGETHGDWWIILQKQALLNEINGVIFAPKNFTQHKDFSWSTGVVPFFKLKNEFPNYSSKMVTEFLIHLEFCFKIEDNQTLALLKDEATNVKDTSPDVLEEYYFFPALVSVKNPFNIWEQSDAMCFKCGWYYHCIRRDQFLTTQFLHVLMLRLAFTFALELNPGDSQEDSLSLCRRCSVWKRGIAWLNRMPIETVVEVGLLNQSVVVMMRCHKSKEAKCVQFYSEVIQKVIEAKDDHCKAVEMSESFIHPTNVKYPFTDNIEDVKFYSLTEIASVTISKEANVLDQRGKNPIKIQELLFFDRCHAATSTELLSKLFSEKHSMDEKVRARVLETLNSESKIMSGHHACYLL